MRFDALIALFLVAALAGLDTWANPIPFPESGGQPYTDDYPQTVNFTSEKVVYTIDEEEKAVVDAKYVLQNMANSPVSLNISLPFDSSVPEDLVLFGNGQQMSFRKVNYTYGMDYAFVSFQVDFQARQKVVLQAGYSIRITAYTEPMFFHNAPPGTQYTRYYWCRYIAETGRFWHNNLDTAQFQFRIRKEFYGSGLEGFNITNEGGYVVATETYYNWRPAENIDVRWQRPDTPMTVATTLPYILLVVLVPAALIAVVFIHLRRKKKYRSRQGRMPGMDDGIRPQ
jgi:hypothetical protein